MRRAPRSGAPSGLVSRIDVDERGGFGLGRDGKLERWNGRPYPRRHHLPGQENAQRGAFGTREGGIHGQSL